MYEFKLKCEQAWWYVKVSRLSFLLWRDFSFESLAGNQQLIAKDSYYVGWLIEKKEFLLNKNNHKFNVFEIKTEKNKSFRYQKV